MAFRHIVTASALVFWAASITAPAAAASISKAYSWFPVRGKTLESLEKELYSKGPRLNGSAERYPGATRMEFETRLTFEETQRRCTVSDAIVTLKLKITLPRRTSSAGASPETNLVWRTLAADIKRHEESHAVIAGNYARELERRLTTLSSRRGCAEVKRLAERETAKVLAEHDAEQTRFDRIEGVNFENRLRRLIQYKAQHTR